MCDVIKYAQSDESFWKEKNYEDGIETKNDIFHGVKHY